MPPRTYSCVWRVGLPSGCQLLPWYGTAYNPYRYTGTYFDSASDLYQMGARYYQAKSGRFTQTDPLPVSIFERNRYHYTGGNPVNYTDPTGLRVGIMEHTGGGGGIDTATVVIASGIVAGAAYITVNQINEQIRRGQVPPGFERAEKGVGPYEQDHVHVNGGALNKGGTWKHEPDSPLTGRQRDQLEEWGWEVP